MWPFVQEQAAVMGLMKRALNIKMRLCIYVVHNNNNNKMMRVVLTSMDDERESAESMREIKRAK